MNSTSDVPVWIRLLSWVGRTTQRLTSLPAIARDARLKAYNSSLTWNNGVYEVTLRHERIIAASEDQARELANEQAAKDFPVVEVMVDDSKIVPPYMSDPSGSLILWQIEEMPMWPDDKVAQSKGQLGPPSASETEKVLGRYVPPAASTV